MFQIIRSILDNLKQVKVIPHLLLLQQSSVKVLMGQDMVRWVQEYDSTRLNRSTWANLTWLFELENTKEFRNLFYYRIGNPQGIWNKILLSVAKILYKPLDSLRILTSSIGPGFMIKHGLGSVIAAEKIGRNCLIFQEVVIGYKDSNMKKMPVIGDNVHIGAGAKILGPVIIGDNVDVGANSVVIENVSSNSVVAGVPANFIKHLDDRNG